MSTILRALRRLEQEKSAGLDRSLGEAVANAPRPPPKRSSLRWIAVSGSVAGALAVAAIGFLFLRSSDPAEGTDAIEIAKAPPARASAARPKAPPARRNAERAIARPRTRSSESAEAAPETHLSRALAARAARAESRRTRRPEPAAPQSLPPAALTSEVAVVKRPPPMSRVDDADAEVPPPADVLPQEIRDALATAAARPPAPRAETPPIRAPRARPAEAPPIPAPPPVAEPTPPVSPPRPAPAAPEVKPPVEIAAAEARPTPRAEPRPAPKPAPEPETRPAPKPVAKPAPVARPPVPKLVVERTIWHPYAERRLAIVAIEGSDQALELHEGDIVGMLVVGKIEPSGVVFNHDGAELRRRVGERQK